MIRLVAMWALAITVGINLSITALAYTDSIAIAWAAFVPGVFVGWCLVLVATAPKPRRHPSAPVEFGEVRVMRAKRDLKAGELVSVRDVGEL